MTHVGTLLGASLMLDTFFSKVPTLSNLADGPTRILLAFVRNLVPS